MLASASLVAKASPSPLLRLDRHTQNGPGRKRATVRLWRRQFPAAGVVRRLGTGAGLLPGLWGTAEGGGSDLRRAGEDPQDVVWTSRAAGQETL